MKKSLPALRIQLTIATLSFLAICFHLFLRFIIQTDSEYKLLPLYIALVFGGLPLVYNLLKKIYKAEFGSDILAGIAIVTSILLGEYLAGTLVVLMLSGGEALESYAVGSASSVLKALSKRMPNLAHRKLEINFENITLSEIQRGDLLIIFPHETCPVDGTVIEGHGSMDEAYLTGEPYKLSKGPGSNVLSGAINGEAALTVRVDKLPTDSRYAKIMEVMRRSELERPELQRLGDQLGAYYTPLALVIGAVTWLLTNDPLRFLAVMVIATPCPLLIAIPVAIIGSISLAAKRAIIIKDPLVLEKIKTCKTIIFDKTGTLTYGKPTLNEQVLAPGYNADEVLALVASLEKYSRHPLAQSIVNAAEMKKISLSRVSKLSELPGQGLTGTVSEIIVEVTGRNNILKRKPELSTSLPVQSIGLECIILINNNYAGCYRFRDVARHDTKPFISHLPHKHSLNKIILLSGDRSNEVLYLANQVGIEKVYAEKSPEEKLEIVKSETIKANTIYVGDGINDAPALLAATVGVAFGPNSDVTAESAGVVILDSSMGKVDELLHIGERMRTIALQSAGGGMALSVVGMLLASLGYLPPVAGAIGQELIDVFAVANALRAAYPPKNLSDFDVGLE